MSKTLKPGPRALALMHHFESCALTAYRDVAGVPTIGWGMTYYPAGGRVKIGDTISQEQADAMFEQLLARDFSPAVAAVAEQAPTTPAQFGAMVALAYNIGAAGFRGSSVARYHAAGDYPKATTKFALWNKSGGVVRKGLIRRRAAEAALYRSDFRALTELTHGEVQ
ncbi:lysozyme [Sphingomonas sp. RRHST34]|uniref:Lysozyme n=1 Tax=Sphingomonas citri TaxID=2862499 RepID=A0ABS7BQQ1_9SPHN|nr:lysozyme [Sphingomonas citri]MBW6531937.1 lysozyme [Sphingomonas citri]